MIFEDVFFVDALNNFDQYDDDDEWGYETGLRLKQGARENWAGVQILYRVNIEWNLVGWRNISPNKRNTTLW